MSEYSDLQYRSAGAVVWGIRLALVAVTAVAAWFALEIRSRQVSDAPIDEARFWAVVGLFVVAGTAFGIAVRYPFPRPRVAWGRLIFVLLMLLPAVHAWFTLSEPVTGAPSWLLGPYWFDQLEVVDIGAVLAGVAAASAIGARRKI